MGLHAIGFVGHSADEARDAFYPGWSYITNKVGRERGWSPVTRRQFDDTSGPDGAYLIGDPETVAAKMLHASEVLGGVSRINFQMTASVETEAMKRSIAQLETEVALIIRRTVAPSAQEQRRRSPA